MRGGAEVASELRNRGQPQQKWADLSTTSYRRGGGSGGPQPRWQGATRAPPEPGSISLPAGATSRRHAGRPARRAQACSTRCARAGLDRRDIRPTARCGPSPRLPGARCRAGDDYRLALRRAPWPASIRAGRERLAQLATRPPAHGRRGRARAVRTGTSPPPPLRRAARDAGPAQRSTVEHLPHGGRRPLVTLRGARGPLHLRQVAPPRPHSVSRARVEVPTRSTGGGPGLDARELPREGRGTNSSRLAGPCG